MSREPRRRDARASARRAPATPRPARDASGHAPARRPRTLPDLERLRPFALPVALLATFLVYATALRTFFAQDDVSFLLRARGVEPTPWSLARPLSEGWTWRAMDAAFGLHPLPYHAFQMALHLGSTALVYAIGRTLLRSWPAAFAAALLFGVSPVGFTPLHWTSGIVELLVTFFSLAAFLTWLRARERGSMALAAASGVLVLAALLSKESAILLPGVLLVTHWRLGDRAPARLLVPPLAAAALYAIGFVVTLRLVHYIGSEAYSMTAAPAFVALNALTYLGWLVLPRAVPDAIASMQTGMAVPGAVVALALALALHTQRRHARHPEEIGAAWFLLLLSPGVPLRHHTYLYYLYSARPGLAWGLAGAGRRAVLALAARRRLAPAAAWLAGGALALVVANGAVAVQAREHAMRGSFPLDKTMRESLLLGNAVADLDSARLAPGTPIAFVNPAPIQHVAFADTSKAAVITSYLPLEGALRRGEAIRLFFPDARYRGFGRTLPREWEDAEVFLFRDDGNLRAMGRGGEALAGLGYFVLGAHEWEKAEAMFLRSRALGDTLADATFGLVITRDFLGHRDESTRYAEEFLRRWPNDSRVPLVAQGLAQNRHGAAVPADTSAAPAR